MSVRNYSNTAAQSTLSASIAATDTSIVLTGYSGDPTPPFTAALARGTANEEVVLVTAVVGSTVTVTRAFDGTAAKAQSAGATFQEVVAAIDFREANNHVNSGSAGAHGTTSQIVGVSDTQTLTNKTLTAPTISSPTVTGAETVATSNITTLNVSGVSSLASVSASGTLAVTGATTLAALTASGLITANGSITVPTGKLVTVTDAPAAATSAANKAYVDGKTWPTSALSDAASAPTVSVVVKRDAAGRAQFVNPAAAQDAATKSYVDNGKDAAWQTPTLLNSFANVGGGLVPARYRLLSNGQVEVQGTVFAASGAGKTIFTLPAGYRPASQLRLPVAASDAFGRIDVLTTGDVVMSSVGSATGYVELNFTFYAEA